MRTVCRLIAALNTTVRPLLCSCSLHRQLTYHHLLLRASHSWWTDLIQQEQLLSTWSCFRKRAQLFTSEAQTSHVCVCVYIYIYINRYGRISEQKTMESFVVAMNNFQTYHSELLMQNVSI